MAMAARLLLGALLLSPFVHAEPKRTNSCIMHNKPYDEVHYDKATGKSTVVEQEDWHVTCTVTQGKKVVWTGELPLAHPTGFQDAMDAVRKWMKESKDAQVSDR